MNRILPIILIVALLIIAGVWLSQRSTPNPTEPPQVEESTDTPPIPTEEPAPETEVAQVDPDVVPEGFSLSAFFGNEQTQSFEAAEDILESDKDYQAILRTNKGDLRLELFESETPETVNNFIFLAKHRYYDNIVFHRVLDGFMAQTGDPTGTGRGGPGYQFADEIVDGLSHDKKGILSMANAGPNTNGSQFFLVFDATPWLDGKHTVFGEVIEGLEILDELTRIDPSTPNAIVTGDETLASLVEQGIRLEGDDNMTVEDYLTETLGTLPAMNQSFTIDGFSGVMGRLSNDPAFGFFLQPDKIEQLIIIERPKE